MHKRDLYILFIIFLLSSCTQDIPWEIQSPSPTKLVVEGSISNDSIRHSIVLSKTFSVNDTMISFVQNADVFLKVGEDTIRFEEHDVLSGRYSAVAPFLAQVGKRYELVIMLEEPIDGQRVYTASTLMKAGVDIDSADIVFIDAYEEKLVDVKYEIQYYGQETIGLGDHYETTVTIDNELKSDSVLSENVFFNDQILEGEYLAKGVLKDLIINTFKEIFEDTIQIQNEQQTVYRPRYDKIVITLNSYDKGYGNYLNEALEQISRSEDFLGVNGPAINLKGNVSGGALGYFHSTYVSRDTISFGSKQEKFKN